MIEILVAAVLLLSVLSSAWALWVGAASATTGTVEHSDALRSVLIATESIRRDISQMVYQNPGRDIAVFNRGRAVSFRVPTREDSGDPWNHEFHPISYSLKPIPNSYGAHFLVRRDELTNLDRPLAACFVKDMLVEFVPQTEISPLTAYLEVTMIGMGGPKSRATYTSSMILPLNVMSVGGTYKLLFEED